MSSRSCFNGNFFTDFSQRFVLGSPSVLIYIINGIREETTSICKIFANDILLFSKVNDENTYTQTYTLHAKKCC